MATFYLTAVSLGRRWECIRSEPQGQFENEDGVVALHLW